MHGSESISVIMPVYNEEDTVSEIIRRVLAQKLVDRLIIINDNSRDRSLEKIKIEARRDKRIQYLTNRTNMGKGYSVRRGLSLIKSGIVIIQDADLEYYPEDYKKLVPNVKDDSAVFGTRMRKKNTGHEYTLAKMANVVLTTTFDVLYGRNLTDINTCYKVFKRRMLDGTTLKENDFLIDPEILVSLVKKGYKIKEIDIRYRGRSYKEGKRITAVDGIKQFLFLIEKRFAK